MSNNEESSFAVVIDSSIFKPTLKEGEFEYGSNTIVSAATFINVPLIKYTPGLIFTALPTAEAFEDINEVTLSPVDIVVLP